MAIFIASTLGSIVGACVALWIVDRRMERRHQRLMREQELNFRIS
jgi:hypothetical protein